MREPFSTPKDWAELCTYFNGKPREFELSETQYLIIDKLLGLSDATPVDDDTLTQFYVPAVIRALSQSR